MTITCSVCRSRESRRCLRFLDMDICRKCAGLLVSRIVGYIRDFDKQNPPLHKPPHGKRAIAAHGLRCGKCERQIDSGTRCADCQDDRQPALTAVSG